MTRVGSMQQPRLAEGSDPVIRQVPLPVPVPLVSASPLKCPELDLSLPVSPDPPRPNPASQKRRRSHQQVRFAPETPLAVTVIAEPSNHPLPRLHHKHSSSYSKGQGLHHDGAPRRRAQWTELGPSEEAGGSLPMVPELNTTLALKAELDDVAGAEFNSKKAVQEQLQKSVRTKNSVSARATEGVNVPPSQQLYRALVSVNVEEEELINQALRDRLLLVPPTCSHGNKKDDGPDLQVFFRGDILREKPLLPGEDLTMPLPQPIPRPAHTTFDLYHRQKCWEAGP
ncbi:protein phosphatase 1 regulatory subunit 35 isoform X2 [Esox lucius]|uniref:Protein phosphatase 1 regulatory subunit 35 C-terminal domain-containing protein n=1 Tax=Esox lucius TaxID=8010 RepID=A0A3P8ZY87_ESOLU|nr:protein phosphatase 1 regulatory subunit 35 isoform X2 [Esox lucius]